MTSIISIYRRFPTKESCLEHLEKVRWKDEPCCPYCMSEKVSRKKEIEQRNRWQCSLCRKSFSVTVAICKDGSCLSASCFRPRKDCLQCKRRGTWKCAALRYGV